MEGVDVTVITATRLYHKSMKPIDAKTVSYADKSIKTVDDMVKNHLASPTPKSVRSKENDRLHTVSTNTLCAMAKSDSTAKKEVEFVALR